MSTSVVTVLLSLILAPVPGTGSLTRQAPVPGTDSLTHRRATVSSAVAPEVASPGDSVMLSVEITPNDDVRLFAPGANDFTAVALLLSPERGISIGKPKYPIPKKQSVPGTKKRVPVYDERIQLEQPITISKKVKPGETLTITALLTFQTCDDTVTYRRFTMPLNFTVTIQ